MKKTYTIILLTLLIAKTNYIYAEVNVNDSLALVDLYNSTDGVHWYNNTNWLTDKPVSKWYGISLSNKRVTVIRLGTNNLSGILPLSLSNLNSLSFLDLSSNHLSGNISAITDNTGLSSLYLNNNQLFGDISALANLTFLYTVNLSNNLFSGSIPVELGKSQSYLTSLDLSHNQLSGEIPGQLAKCFYLLYLDLSNNRLTGSIPPNLGNLNGSYFNHLDLSYNGLSGDIPDNLGNLRALEFLSLSNNQVSGNIPRSLAQPWNMVYFSLSNNKLTGSIPRDIGTRFYYLETLDLSNNQLSGGIPSSFGYLYNLKRLYLNDNKLTDTIPSSLGNLINLFSLFLTHNNFEGRLPIALGNLLNLKILAVSHNNLNGVIPASFSNLKKIRKISIADNELRGALPSFLTTLSQLENLDILHNHFTFDGMEPLVQHNFDTLVYNYERKINIHENGNMLSVNAGGTLANNTYKWFKDGVLTATTKGDSTFVPTASGIYSVQVTNSICTELTLYSSNDTVNSLSPQQQNITLSQLNNKTDFSVHPNPAHSYINIYFANTATTNAVINVYDANGKKLITQKTRLEKVNSIRVNISSFTAGVYFIETKTGDKTITRKFVKE